VSAIPISIKLDLAMPQPQSCSKMPVM